MKKILFFALAIMALASLGAMAASEGDPLPAGATDPGTWVWNGSEWEKNAAYAMSWNSAPEDSGGMSNKATHSFDIVNHVSVAQWVSWTISGTRKDWRVLRPGIYASDSVTATIRSNNDLNFSFWAEDPVYQASGGVTTEIPKWFSFSEGDDAKDAEENGWIRGSDYSSDEPYTFTISDSAGLHTGLAYKIWERIEVEPSNSSSEYEGGGRLTISLTNVKHWVDGDTGTWHAGSNKGFGPLDNDHWTE